MVRKSISLIKHQDEIVDKYLTGYTIPEILKKHNITHNEFLAIMEAKSAPLSKRHLSKTTIENDQIIIIGDTHIGSKKENFDYIDSTYAFAEKNNIHNIVHLGDLFQAGINPVKKEYQDPDNQFAYFQKRYPKSDSVKTHILFGNHDLKLLDKEDEYLRVLSSRKDFDVLGFKRAYLTWGKHLISLYHEVRHYHVNIPNVDTTIHLEGHKHAYSEKGKTITVPSLSDDMKYYFDSISEPGFLLASETDKGIKMNLLSFEGNHLHNKGLVYVNKKK